MSLKGSRGKASTRCKMRLGIFGGTFDPIHLGHLLTAEAVLERLSLDKVIFIPAQIPPHKRDKIITPPEKRLKMAKLAAAYNENFIVSDIELKREGPSYSVDTISELKNIYTQAEFFFIIGSDAINDIATWHEAKRLIASCNFAAATRAGEPLNRKYLREYFGEIAHINIMEVKTPQIDISSTDIRRRIGEGKNISYMVTKEVAEYIKREGLYL